MPAWIQHTLVLSLAALCLGVVFRDALRALGNHASKLGGCGSCKGCGTEVEKSHGVSDESPAGRVSFIPADALTARAGVRRSR